MACPFTHVGLRRLVDRRRAVGSPTMFHIRAWPLELVNEAPLDPAVVAEEVEQLRAQVAPDLFRGFEPSHVPTTSLPAFALAHAAYRHGPQLGEQVSLALRVARAEPAAVRRRTPPSGCRRR
jgi:hypothetical protein